MEYHPSIEGVDTTEYFTQYDAVLDLSESRYKTLSDLKQEMDTSGISHAIIHAEYEFGDPANVINKAVAKLVNKYPHKFSGFGTISMEKFRISKAIKQLHEVNELGLLGINIQPAFFNMSIKDKRLYPLYYMAQELELVVALHTGINYSTAHPIKYEHPLLIDRVACDFPNLRLIACHASWPWIPEIVAIARKHPQLYLDFGGLSPRYIGVSGSGWEMMYHFMDNLLSEQILFATDWPTFPMQRAVDEWNNLGLRQETLSKAFNKNVKRLFDMEKTIFNG